MQANAFVNNKCRSRNFYDWKNDWKEGEKVRIGSNRIESEVRISVNGIESKERFRIAIWPSTSFDTSEGGAFLFSSLAVVFRSFLRLASKCWPSSRFGSGRHSLSRNCWLEYAMSGKLGRLLRLPRLSPTRLCPSKFMLEIRFSSGIPANFVSFF